MLRTRFPGLEVRLRPHPAVRRTCPLEDDLAGACFVVARTSTSAVDALLAGIPTVVTDPASICWMLCGHGTLAVLDDPPRPARTPFFRDLAYAQWTHDEMENGEAWAHLFRS